jgi:hypothetical protein
MHAYNMRAVDGANLRFVGIDGLEGVTTMSKVCGHGSLVGVQLCSWHASLMIT